MTSLAFNLVVGAGSCLLDRSQQSQLLPALALLLLLLQLQASASAEGGAAAE
jgi:hypothetical protein